MANLSPQALTAGGHRFAFKRGMKHTERKGAKVVKQALLKSAPGAWLYPAKAPLTL